MSLRQVKQHQTRYQTQLALQNSLHLRRFDRSNKNSIKQPRPPPSSLDNISDSNDDAEFKPLLWKMLHLACLGMNMEEIQKNPIIVRYVENMFDSDDDGEHVVLTRLGVIADWKSTVDDDNKKQNQNHPQQQQDVIITGVGAAWIQCWNPNKPGLEGYGTVRHDVPELTMAVLPEYQAKGIGQGMLQELIRYAQAETSIPGISLGVQADNFHAVRMYQGFGFQAVQGSDYTNEQGTTWYDMVLWF